MNLRPSDDEESYDRGYNAGFGWGVTAALLIVFIAGLLLHLGR